MRSRRKIALAIGTVLVALLAIVVGAPFLLRGKIEARIKQTIAAHIDARVDWRDLNVGLLRTFPNFSLQLNHLVVTGVEQFAGDTLLAVPRFRLVLDLGSVLGSIRNQAPVVVRSV